MTDVASKVNNILSEYFKSNMFPGIGYLVQRHAVHLDGRLVLLLLEVDVAHVNSESS